MNCICLDNVLKPVVPVEADFPKCDDLCYFFSDVIEILVVLQGTTAKKIQHILVLSLLLPIMSGRGQVISRVRLLVMHFVVSCLDLHLRIP